MRVDKKFDKLEEAVNFIYKEASKYAVEGVETGVGGPFGAGIIEKQAGGKFNCLVISRNEVIKSKNPTKHAEMNAIEEACKIKDSIFLDDCILVTTAKSCPMCLSASVWAKIPVIYYSEDFGQATKGGFKDDDISEYIKGNNPKLIKEIQEKNENCNKPFEAWNSKQNKVQY